MRANHVGVALWVYGAPPPAGVPAVRSWSPGDKRRVGKTRHDKPGWYLEGSLPRTATLDEQVANLLELVMPYTDYFEYRAPFVVAEIAIEVSVWAGLQTPSLTLRASTLETMSRLRLAVDIDLYVHSDPGAPQ